MPIPPLRNETQSLQRANYLSQLLRSQQEMTSGIHVIGTACQRKSALDQIKCKHQLKSRIVETVQSEMSLELPNKPAEYMKFNLAQTNRFCVIVVSQILVDYFVTVESCWVVWHSVISIKK